LLLQSISVKALSIQQFARNRIGSNKNKSNLDDIIYIWTIADEHSIIDIPCFCAANLSRIPVLNDELADIALIKKTVCDLEKQVRDLSGNLATMTTEYTGNWLNDAQSFPSLCSTGTSRVTQSAAVVQGRGIREF